MSKGGFIVPKAWQQVLLKECSRMRRKTLGLDTWIIEEVLFQFGRIWKFFFGKKRISPVTRVLHWWEKPPEHVNCRCIMPTEEEMKFIRRRDVRTEELKPFKENTYQSLLRFLGRRQK